MEESKCISAFNPPFAFKNLIHEEEELHRCQLIRKPCYESQKLPQKFEEGKDEDERRERDTK